MPTGYTAGILDGKIKNFPQFAEQCMRAFMPCIHMRDDSLDKKYVPRKQSNYLIKELKESKSNLKKWQSYSDKEIISIEKSELKEKKKYCSDRLKKIKKDKNILEKILSQVINWNPPTSEHGKFRQFMMEQIETTIRMDVNPEYHIDEFWNIESKLKNMNAENIRQEKIKRFTEDIEYNQKHLNDDIENCKTANKWCEELIKSLK